MNLKMDAHIAEQYTNQSQKIRVMTEYWVGQNLYCPYCGDIKISQFENNRPVADFECSNCKEQYELKSKNGSITNKINDGAYRTMIKRVESINNPNFFFMQYARSDLRIKNFILVPKYFFSKEIIEQRKPLAKTAKRAGWVGCNILLNQVPKEGKIFIVKDEVQESIDTVIKQVKKTEFISAYKLENRGWILDVLNCIQQIEGKHFNLEQMYQFEQKLAIKYPENKHIKEKIRQQLQILRDKGLITFDGRGHYSKL